MFRVDDIELPGDDELYATTNFYDPTQIDCQITTMDLENCLSYSASLSNPDMRNSNVERFQQPCDFEKQIIVPVLSDNLQTCCL